MLKMLKKYRNDSKRTVLTFSCQRRMTLNRLGDLTDKYEIQGKLNAKAEKGLGEIIDQRINDAACECKDGSDRTNDAGECDENDKGYLLETDGKYLSCDKLKNKRALVKGEQTQILEKDESCFAFKQNYHIKPLEHPGDACNKEKNLLKPDKELRGGIVMEKSFKILLCDLVAAALGAFALFCAVKKLKDVFKAK